MLFEAIAAGIVGVLAIWMILDPLVRTTPPAPVAYEPPDPLETRRGQALAALREIEFDRETGKLSDVDYEELRTKYTEAAVQALRSEDAEDPIERLVADRVQAIRGRRPGGGGAASPMCPSCGPRPEADAVFCSSCGRALPGSDQCGTCGSPLTAGGKYCGNCGSQVAA